MIWGNKNEEKNYILNTFKSCEIAQMKLGNSHEMKLIKPLHENIIQILVFSSIL